MRTITALVLGALCSLVSGCSGTPSAVYVLVDISSSTETPEIRRQMGKDFQTVAQTWAETGGVLRGDAVGSDVLNRSTVPIDANITAFNAITSDEEFHRKKVVTPALASLRRQFEQVLGSKASESTEILNALTVAAKVLNGDQSREAGSRAIVILSDMVEESSLYNFRRNPPSDGRIEEIIQAETKAGRLPSLKGVRVWKAGSSKDLADSSASRQVEKFWEKYFAAAGAELKPEHYGASLMDFRLGE